MPRKLGARYSSEPLASCYVRFPTVTIIVVVTELMNSKFLEANNNSPFRLLLNKLNLAKNFMVVGALFPFSYQRVPMSHGAEPYLS